MNDPFRYFPHPVIKDVASSIGKDIESLGEEEKDSFEEGKMLGVALVRDKGGKEMILKGFSGLIAGKSMVDGFVPPVFDLSDPEGFFKKGEKELDRINDEMDHICNSEPYRQCVRRLHSAQNHQNDEIESFKAEIERKKQLRDAARMENSLPEDELKRESSFLKAELRRLKIRLQARVDDAAKELEVFDTRLSVLKARRKTLSEQLQEKLFRAYIVHNHNGEPASIWDIFRAKGLVPPGGSGDCAGVKLLEYAFANGLEPVCMGEFWYGRSALASGRIAGHFYPSCTSKCGPIIEYMTGRKALQDIKGQCPELDILYRDEHIIAVDKPSGYPSVPGLLERREDVQSALSRQVGSYVYPAHRLDMDTSGVLLFALDFSTQIALMEQFADGAVDKKYVALLSPGDGAIDPEGRIDLPISPDYADRPRQKAGSGKEASTSYRILEELSGGIVRIELHPHQGRTHQLRVHCSNPAGLARPILGDTLYGGDEAERLMLSAEEISFIHPHTQRKTTVRTKILF